MSIYSHMLLRPITLYIILYKILSPILLFCKIVTITSALFMVELF